MPPPTLLTEGDSNSIGPAGASPTTLRLQWRKPDCAPVERFAIRLKEGAGNWVTVYEGHPGGGFSPSDTLQLIASPGPAPLPPPAPPSPPADEVSGLATILGVVMAEPHDTRWNTAENCVNGNYYDMCMHRYPYSNAWLSLRVEAASAIHQVTVYNRRSSCCYTRINPYEIWVGASYGDTSSAHASRCGGEPAATSSHRYGPLTTDCRGAVGEFVTVLLPGSHRYLHLAEVQIQTTAAATRLQASLIQGGELLVSVVRGAFYSPPTLTLAANASSSSSSSGGAEGSVSYWQGGLTSEEFAAASVSPLLLPTLEAGADGTKRPLSHIRVSCRPSDVQTISDKGCAETIDYRRMGVYSYTQGGLGYESTYSFSVNALGLDGAWRGWSEPALLMTAQLAETTSTVTVEPECDAEGLSLTSLSGVISKHRRRSVSTSTCSWKLTPSGLDPTKSHRIYVAFEPHPDFPAAPFRVGSTIFSPIGPSDMQAELKTGVVSLVVESAGSTPCASIAGQTTGSYSVALIFEPPRTGETATGTLTVRDGFVPNVENGGAGYWSITASGSGYTHAPHVSVSGCPEVVVRSERVNVVNNIRINRQGTGYTSAPNVSLVGGHDGHEGFIPAQFVAALQPGSQGSDLEVRLEHRQSCSSEETATSSSCQCSLAWGHLYTSTPSLELTGGVQDYVELKTGLSAKATSLTPRAGTIAASVEGLAYLRYFAAELPLQSVLHFHHS